MFTTTTSSTHYKFIKLQVRGDILVPRSVGVLRTPLSLRISRKHVRSEPNVGAVVMAGHPSELVRVASTLQVDYRHYKLTY
jgi:hypothetical protein